MLPHQSPGLKLPGGIELSDDELTTLERGIRRGDLSEGVLNRVLAGEARYTTRVQLEREHRVLDGVTAPSPVSVDRETLEAAISKRHLVAEQADAMRHLADFDGRVVALVGPGGSGKTYAISAYSDAAQAAGHRVVGVATSATAARKLSEDLNNAWTGTIAMMRHQLDGYDAPLPYGTLVVVDEASMVPTKDLAWLVDQAELYQGKVVLVGDPKQLPSIDSGGLFHRIVTDGQGVVTDLAGLNPRQTLDVDRHALKRFREGEVSAAVCDYEEAGRLHLGTDEYMTKTAMVDAWWADTRTHGLEAVRMLASRRDEAAMLNQLARVRMTQNRLLNGPVLVNRLGSEFQTGDRIVVRDNWYAHSDLRNGQTGTIVTIHPNTGTITIRRDVDGAVVDLPRQYVDRSVDHAYAQTIHTAQGQTFQTSHLYLDIGVAAEHGYTGLSRARDETHLWVNNSRTVQGDCIQPHDPPAAEPYLDSIVRQLTRTVVEPPATTQGLAVETATDHQLHQWLQQLEDTLRSSPLGERINTEDLVRIEEAVVEARAVAKQLGTSGAQSQVQSLEEHRRLLVDRITERETWIEDNTDILHTYIAINDELRQRVAATGFTHQLQPPADVLEAIGPRPSSRPEAARWDAAVIHHAEARIRLGPEADLADPSVLEAAQWRDAISAFHAGPELERTPILRLVG